jgi:hypothetical protein
MNEEDFTIHKNLNHIERSNIINKLMIYSVNKKDSENPFLLNSKTLDITDKSPSFYIGRFNSEGVRGGWSYELKETVNRGDSLLINNEPADVIGFVKKDLEIKGLFKSKKGYFDIPFNSEILSQVFSITVPKEKIKRKSKLRN